MVGPKSVNFASTCDARDPTEDAEVKAEPEFDELRPNVAIVLKNGTCVYCAKPFGTTDYTKEHVIGTKFVPKGTLNQEWNLILRACRPCNHEKSKLEDDISAITMQPDGWGKLATNNPILATEAIRKGKSKSQRTSKPVNKSSESLSIETPSFGPGVTMTFGFTSPPQVDDDRAARLALLHSRAFFYWLTYKKTTLRGGFWPGGFFPLPHAVRSDWGNPLHRSFMDIVAGWHFRLIGVSAKGFFKVAIRRHPTAECWSYAYEWNQQVRVIGCFGDQACAQDVVNRLLQPAPAVLRQEGNRVTRYREEIRLIPGDDKLFSR